MTWQPYRGIETITFVLCGQVAHGNSVGNHGAQLYATTGEALSGPAPTYLGGETTPPRTAAFLNNTNLLKQHIRTQSIHAYPTKTEAGWLLVAL